MSLFQPRQGEVCLADLDPVRGRELAKRRPVVIVSVDAFSSGPSGLVIVVPISTTHRGLAMEVRIEPPEGKQDRVGYAQPWHVRTISAERLGPPRGRLADDTLRDVLRRVRMLLADPG